MLVGYVSDERFVAIPDVLFEFEEDRGSVEARSRASGAVHAELRPGPYRVTLNKPGFGGKRVAMTVGENAVHHFRLLSDCLLGYPWPKWVKAGERAEFNEQVTNPIEGRTACHLAPAEWRLLGWLEREGFEYDYYAETQFHFGQLNLDDYGVLILSTHPEYWSREMYSRLKTWVYEHGGNLLYLGGNGLNSAVELLDEATIVVQNGDERAA